MVRDDRRGRRQITDKNERDVVRKERKERRKKKKGELRKMLREREAEQGRAGEVVRKAWWWEGFEHSPERFKKRKD